MVFDKRKERKKKKELKETIQWKDQQLQLLQKLYDLTTQEKKCMAWQKI